MPAHSTVSSVVLVVHIRSKSNYYKYLTHRKWRHHFTVFKKRRKKKLYDCVEVVAAAADGHVITRNITEAFFSLSLVGWRKCV